MCKNAPYTVLILEKSSTSIASKKKKQREKEWMLKLQTVFLYGLKDRLGDGLVKEERHLF